MKKKSDPFLVLGVSLAILLGGFVRLVHVVGIDFPLNDGGFFYTMVGDLRAAGYALPIVTSFNQAQIPFAYPPLGFYLAGFLTDLFKIDLLDIIRLLPALISVLTIPAFYLLSREILPSKRERVFATFGFALLPTAFDWLIVGGGLTRAPGYLFAILMLQQTVRLYRTRSRRYIFTTAIFASLTILSHPGTTWFAAYSALALFIFMGKYRITTLRQSLIVVGEIILLTAPWWLTVVSRHGWQVFTYPFQTESPSLITILIPFSLLFTNEPLMDILVALGLLGFLVCLRDRRWLPPLWLAAVFIFEPRLSATYSVIPMALLVGSGVEKVILWATTRQDNIYESNLPLKQLLPKITLAFLLLYTLVAAFIAPQYQSLDTNQRAAMQWIAENTPPESQFLVISGRTEYGVDHVSEWFPSLTGRVNLTVPQGYEWLPGGVFNQRAERHADLQNCAHLGIGCLEQWVKQHPTGYTHLYIVKSSLIEMDETNFLRSELSASGKYTQIYDIDGGTIFKVLSP